MKNKTSEIKAKILSIDPWLTPYREDIKLRMMRFTDIRKALLGENENIDTFANGYMYYGFHRTETGWVYREWAPGADAMHLIGDFNGWNRESHPLHRINDAGDWEITLDGSDALRHEQLVKVQVTRGGKTFDRIPAYIERAVQSPGKSTFDGQIWAPDVPFHWTDGGYGKRKNAPLYIYEAHIGMAQEEPRIGTYREFTEKMLPRIKNAGYNCIQLMAIQEHPYYASFGYQVSNFFAPTSRFGTPDELRELVNTAHAMGLYVIMDLVQSHACTNSLDGLNMFDGTEDQYFHSGERGNHPAWGTKLFNYGKHEVIHFLLSNVKYWLDQFHFDGFRFDGITSMIYRDHGLGVSFTGYGQYFSMNTDVEAVTYLQLANELVHRINPLAVTIAEDMSGMPGMCVPIRNGGIGFDYRLAMGIPDMWIKLTDKTRDEDWDMYAIWHELTTRRPNEKSIGYCESHDQALVGDKTLMFRMADSEMYMGMNNAYHSYGIDRAVALHKMFRLITLVLACDGYLNFMGNEFGHPEWIDFPREGNGYSFHYARRQWSLAENPFLKYKYLAAFDNEMLKLSRKYRILNKTDLANLWIDPEKKIIAFYKGGLLYIFNFHPTESQEAFFLPAHPTGEGIYSVVFSTDEQRFGGEGLVSLDTNYKTTTVEGRGLGFYIYTPARTAMVLKKQG